MGRDFWNTIRLALRVDKIKGSLTLPAATYDCGFERASVYHPNNTSPLRLPSNITLSSTAVTIDFWAKIFPSQTASYDFLALVDSGATREIRMSISQTTGLITISAITSAGSYSFTVPNLYFNNWTRFTITFSTANLIMKLYVNSVLVNSVVIAGNLTNNTFAFAFGTASFLTQANSYLNELALYSVEQTAEDIAQTNSYKANIGAYGTTLVGYWKLNNLEAGGAFGVTSIQSVGSISLDSGSVIIASTTEDYAPIKFGASFVAVQYDVILPAPTSIQFPKRPPTGMTGMVVLRWTDSDDVVQRRKLWALDGVDIGPIPATYNGERLTADFTIEVWNIDGEATVVIPSDIILRVARTTNPTTSYDSTAVASATITADSTLAAEFPITFPLTFITQQAYTP